MSLIGNLINKAGEKIQQIASSKAFSFLDSKPVQGYIGNPNQKAQQQAQKQAAAAPQQSMGTQAKAPASKPTANTLPSSQVKTPAVKPDAYSPAPAPAVQPNPQPQQPYDPNNGLYGKLVAGIASQPQSQDIQLARSSAQQLQDMGTSNDNIEAARSNLAKQIGIDTDAQAAIRSQAIPLEFQQGRAQVLQQAQQQKENQLQGLLANLLQQRSQQQSALSSAGNLGLSTQSQNQNALSTAAGLAKPQFVDYGSAQFDPVTGTYKTAGGGAYGTGPQAAINVQSVKDAQNKINTIDQSASAIDNNFSRAISFASQAGLTGDAPLLTQIQTRFGQNFQTNPSVAGFLQVVQALNSQLQAFGEQPIDPNNATLTQLKQAQEVVKNNLATQKNNYQQFISNFSGTSSSNSSSGGGIWSW